MKKIILSLLCFFAASVSYGAVLTVSNNIANPGQYNRVDSAIFNAQPYDTIYIHASPTSYGSITVNKPLTLLGAGHHPQKQVPFVTIVGWVYITSNAVVIDGLRMSIGGVNANGGTRDSIRIRNCEMDYNIDAGFNWPLTNWIVENNIIRGGNWPWSITLNNALLNNFVIRNNILHNTIYNISTQAIIEHNFFFGTAANAFSNVNNSVIINNIFYLMSPGGASTSVFNNNITFNTIQDVLPYGSNSGTGNIADTDPQLVNYPLAGGTFQYYHDYHLLPSSPGYNAATDGTDIGIWGGVGFTMTGEPSVPVVRLVDIQNPNVPVGGTLNVHMKSSKAIK
jgi:hypothetical protein